MLGQQKTCDTEAWQTAPWYISAKGQSFKSVIDHLITDIQSKNGLPFGTGICTSYVDQKKQSLTQPHTNKFTANILEIKERKDL